MPGPVCLAGCRSQEAYVRMYVYRTCKCYTVHCTVGNARVKAAVTACVSRLANSAAAHASFSWKRTVRRWRGGWGETFSISETLLTVRHSNSLSVCFQCYETLH